MNLRSIDLNLLVVLDAILDEKHVGRAGERLGLSASATSHALERLRKLLGDPLLIRSSTGMEPTPRALHMAGPLRQALSDIQVTLLPQQFNPSTATTCFTIAIASYETIPILPYLLNMLKNDSPNIQLKLISSSASDILAGIAQGTTDLALGHFTDLPPRFMTSRLMKDDFICAMRADHPLASQTMTMDHYLSASHLLVNVSGSSENTIDTILAKNNVSRHASLQVSNALAAIMALSQSDLIATLTKAATKIFSAYTPLCLKPLPFDIPDLEFKLVWNQRFNHSASHRWLRERLVEIGAKASEHI